MIVPPILLLMPTEFLLLDVPLIVPPLANAVTGITKASTTANAITAFYILFRFMFISPLSFQFLFAGIPPHSSTSL